MKRRRFRINVPAATVEKMRGILADLEATHDEDRCWPWPYGFRGQYGVIYGPPTKPGRKARTYVAPRVAWVAAGNEFPNGDLTIDHMCHFPPCVNPAHLRLLTLEDNAKDAADYVKGKQFYRTHCFKGHPLSGSNCRVDRLRSGRLTKVCRTCEAGRRERYLAWQASKAEAAADA